MHPTQALLEQRHYDFLTEEARRCDTSPAALLRELVEARMEETAASGSALDRIVGIGASEGDELPESEHDSIIYGFRDR
jgi:hypothetical protein